MAAEQITPLPLIVIVGETASGKTALGIELARKFNGEIICADSRTVYKGMDIGTAKPTKEERELAQHHLLDIVEPDQEYNVARFQKDARKLIDYLASINKLPIMVGGTGLYVDSVIFNYDFDNKTKGDLRPNTLVIGLANDRDELLSRIEQRVDVMLQNGLLAEVKKLGTTYGWDSPALKVIGYKQFAAHIHGKISLEEARQETIHETKLFAKRQRTWFRRPVYQESIHWITSLKQATDLVMAFLNTK